MDLLGYDLIDVLKDHTRLMSIISATNPDVLLMDIDLGDNVSGIDLVLKINEMYDIPTVYLTSFADDQTFNEAKTTFPAAYITKPYDADELKRAIELAVFSNQDKRFSSANRKNRFAVSENIFIKNANTLVKVSIPDIRLIEAYDKYCYIFTTNQKYMIKERLKNILLQLPESLFCQVHRSYIINISSIESIDLHQNNIIVMGKSIGIGKTFKQNLFANVNTIG